MKPYRPVARLLRVAAINVSAKLAQVAIDRARGIEPAPSLEARRKAWRSARELLLRARGYEPG